MRAGTVAVAVLTACGGAGTAEPPPMTVAASPASAPVVTSAPASPVSPMPDTLAASAAPTPNPFETPASGAPLLDPSASPSSSLLGASPAAGGGSDVVAGAEPALRIQVLLDRARFSAGEIDGKDGANTRAALAAYAGAQRLGGPEAARATLLSDGTPALARYTVTADDVAGPFTKVPQDMMAKAELKALSYSSAMEALAEKFHASPALLERLNPGKALEAGETIVVPNVQPAAAGKAARVVVDKSDASVRVYDASDRILARFPATMGSRHDPLPVGPWKVTGVSRNPTFNYNPDLFWDADPDHAKAKIAPGPNNPVGVVWIDLSRQHYGIHGTPEPSQIGKTQSHGCIRLTNWDAAALADMVQPGTPAILQE